MVTSNRFFLIVLSQLAYHLPTIITWLIGVIVAARCWSRRPRQSLLVMLASIIALTTTVA